VAAANSSVEAKHRGGEVAGAGGLRQE